MLRLGSLHTNRGRKGDGRDAHEKAKKFPVHAAKSINFCSLV